MGKSADPSPILWKNSLAIVIKVIASALAGFILFKAAQEYYLYAPVLGTWLGKLSPKWALTFGGIALFCIAVFIVVLIILWLPEKAKAFEPRLAAWRERLGWLRWPLAMGLALLPAWFFLFTYWGTIFTGLYLRLLFLLVDAMLIAVLASQSSTHLVQQQSLYLGFLLVSSVFYCGQRLTAVTTFPFSLSWSEGNRLYDYSLYFGRSRYDIAGELSLPHYAPGRHLLWGLLFLIPNTPIWLHRLWDVLLSTLPYILLGYVFARWGQLNRLGKWIFTLWIFLFLVQGPIYTPLILSALLVALLVQPKRWLVSLVVVAIAGFYASSSRWTWLLAPGTWAVLILMSDFEMREGEDWRSLLKRLAPIALTGSVGYLGGMLSNAKLFSPKELAESTALSQPLLWYRLLPNATYSEGILLGILRATLPLIILLVWLVITRRWTYNWLQRLAYGLAIFGFFTIGLVASVKIGGGNNLHNLDMYIVTLALLSALVLRERKALSIITWPSWVQVLVLLVVFIPSWFAMRGGAPLDLPPQQDIERTLKVIQTDAAEAATSSEVLFLDERQLLTFGFVKGVPLVSEYEKKYLMDQAMEGDREFFARFYQDLTDKRFSLIITDPLFSQHKKDSSDSFGEENNAWIKYIARPVLCYYEPDRTFRSIRIQLLVPRAKPKNCP